MMMRGITILLWPYVAVALMDKLGKLCLGCEGIVCRETKEMYRFVVNFIQKKCPALNLKDVKIGSADQFSDQEDFVEFGFTNAVYVIDCRYLMNLGLADHFGWLGEEKSRGHLIQMINAQSEYKFEQVTSSAKYLLASIVPCDQDLENKLDTFIERKNTMLFTSYKQYLVVMVGWVVPSVNVITQVCWCT